MAIEATAHEAKTQLSRLRDRALVGEEVVDTAPSRRNLGTAVGDFIVPEDFDAPLPEEVLNGLEL